jgi:formyltetrahydrofolate-dependent phosphoribosylglycinamide formyltransferase
MFERLQKKWNVSGFRLVIIICIFAFGGSLTGYIAKKITDLLFLDKGVAWFIIYLLLVVLIWPMTVFLVSVPFGQFRFFKNYIQRIGSRVGIGNSRSIVNNPEPVVKSQNAGPSLKSHSQESMTNIAIFASGTGSNAQKIIDHFRNHASIQVSLIICNKRGAGVLSIAEKENIPSLVIEKEPFFSGDAYTGKLKEAKIDFIVLAGFLWKIPTALIKAFPGRIINIHPALLPKYGGKGMYGNRVHEAIIANGEAESGITIHYVDEIYDHGQIIFQAKCPVLPNDTAITLAKRIHRLEHAHYSTVIEKLLST